MTNISDLLDMDELAQMMAEKRINKQVHPTLPISIYNYSNHAQFMNKWTKAERVCRGLIVEDDTGKVIARGPEKFFNYGQTGAPVLETGDKVIVTRKEDGSLGIGWTYKGQHGVATRGSFTSDQAVHATALLSASDKRLISLYAGKDQTQIWEVVYPENRIVLSYGDRDEIIPLGKVDNGNGLIYSRKLNGIQVDHLSVPEALSLPIPDDEEGYVLDILRNSILVGHVKLKGEEYLRRHKLIFGLSDKSVYHAMVEGNHYTYIADLPDEFQEWAKQTADGLTNKYNSLIKQINTEFAKFSHLKNRKDFALAAAGSHLSKYLFLRLDGKTVQLDDLAWKSLEPIGGGMSVLPNIEG